MKKRAAILLRTTLQIRNTIEECGFLILIMPKNFEKLSIESWMIFDVSSLVTATATA